jgi:hypothetical protein
MISSGVRVQVEYTARDAVSVQTAQQVNVALWNRVWAVVRQPLTDQPAILMLTEMRRLP